MKIDLTIEQVTALRRIQKKERFNRRRFIKATVLLMLHRGLSIEDIEVSLNIDDNTVRRYVRGFLLKGLDEYLKDSFVPYSGKLVDQESKQLKAHLLEHLYLDVKPIIEYVYKEYGVTYSVSDMRDLLHLLGFVYKHSKAVAAKADEEALLAFMEQTLPALLAEEET